MLTLGEAIQGAIRGGEQEALAKNDFSRRNSASSLIERKFDAAGFPAAILSHRGFASLRLLADAQAWVGVRVGAAAWSLPSLHMRASHFTVSSFHSLFLSVKTER